MGDVKKIGVIVGREWSFPPAFIEEVNKRDAGVVAEYVKLGGTRMNEPVEYAVYVDRISHEIPYYRTYLKNAVLQGAFVINNPFWWSADDKFFESSLATQLGVPVPKTLVLPMKEYPDGVVSESLRNLSYPLDWDAIVEYVGLPAILKDAWGGGWRNVYKVSSVDELITAYNETGTLCMVLQEFIEWDQFVRCICIGQENIMPIKYDPGQRRYLVEHQHLNDEVGERVVDAARHYGVDLVEPHIAIDNRKIVAAFGGALGQGKAAAAAARWSCAAPTALTRCGGARRCAFRRMTSPRGTRWPARPR